MIERESVRRLAKWLNGIPQPPVGLELAPTLRCNLTCEFCWRMNEKAKIDREELTLLKYQELLQEAGKLGVLEVKSIGGGDTLMRHDAIDILQSIKDNGMRGYLCTSGTLLNEEKIQRLNDMNFDHIKFSIHGLGATHDQLIGLKGAFMRVLGWIERLNKNIDVEIGMVVVRKNVNEITQLAKIASDLKVNSFFLEPITIYSQLGEKIALRPEDQRILCDQVGKTRRWIEEQGVQLNTNLDGFLREDLSQKTGSMKHVILAHAKGTTPGARTPCYEPFLRMGIRSNGRVGPCGFFDERTSASIQNTSLSDVWYGPYFQERRTEMRERQLPGYCDRCCTTLVMNNAGMRAKLANHQEKKGNTPIPTETLKH